MSKPKSLIGTVFVEKNRYGIVVVEPLHEVGLRLGISPDEMHRFLKENSLQVTEICGLGVGLSNLEVRKLEAAFCHGGYHE
ncbi:MAG: hypothetical protein VXY16_03265 [Pseudomonadota bacterium]|nr:hypothetical protein [Pseudomonadota bacterium]